MSDALRSLASLLGTRGEPPAVAPRLSELPWSEQALQLSRARWDATRPTTPDELETPAVYTVTSSLRWLARAEARHSRAVTTKEILTCVGFRYPTTRACKLLALALKKAGAVSRKEKGQTHLRWSSPPARL